MDIWHQVFCCICESMKWATIISGNGLLSVWRQAITGANVEILSFGHSGINLGPIGIPIQNVLSWELHENVCKKAAVLVRPLFNVLNMIILMNQTHRNVWLPNRHNSCTGSWLSYRERILIIVFFDVLCWNFRNLRSLRMAGVTLVTSARGTCTVFGTYNWME